MFENTEKMFKNFWDEIPPTEHQVMVKSVALYRNKKSERGVTAYIKFDVKSLEKWHECCGANDNGSNKTGNI